MINKYQGVQTSTCIWNVTNFRTYQRNNDNRQVQVVKGGSGVDGLKMGIYKVRSRKAISTSSTVISLAIPLT